MPWAWTWTYAIWGHGLGHEHVISICPHIASKGIPIQYWIVGFKEFRNISDSDKGRIVFNFASKNDPCIRIVQLLAERYPRLSFDFGYVNFETGENAKVSFVNFVSVFC